MTTSQNHTSAIGRRRSAARNANNAVYEDRRSEIINAAAELFKEKGYQRTTLSDVAQRLSTDRASLYYYFGSREDIFDSVVSDVVRNNLTIAEAIRDGTGSAPVKLRKLVVSLMESFAEHYPFLYVYLQENMAQVAEKRQAWAKEMRAINKSYEDTIESIVQQGLDEGTIKPIGDATVITYGLMGMLNWTNRWFNPSKTRQSASEVGETFANLLLDGLSNYDDS